MKGAAGGSNGMSMTYCGMTGIIGMEGYVGSGGTGGIPQT